MKGTFVKILISEKQTIFTEGLKTVLSDDKQFYIVGSTVTAKETLSFAQQYHPDIILIDPVFDDMDNLQLLSKLTEIKPPVNIIFITEQKDEDFLIHSLEKGIQSILPKDVSPQKLINSILSVYNGETLVSEILATKLLKNMISREKNLELLSSREKEVLGLVAEGLSNKQIGKKLFISERTVKNHLSSVYRKINVKDRTQAAVFLVKENLIL